MRYSLALSPILLVLVLMIRWRWGAHQAGFAGWLAGLVFAAVGFGMTARVLWVSQAKGLLLSVFVLGVMWPALFLYHWIDQRRGIAAIARLFKEAIPNRGMCLILVAWSLSGLLEGLAGFGLPVAVVAPMLVALEVPALTAVAAVAVGHSWAVTFGDMGVILQTLSAVVGLEVAQIVPWAALLLGVACLFCGLGAAWLLGQLRQWPTVVGLAVAMALAQYGLAASGLAALSAFGAGLAGIVTYLACEPFKKVITGNNRPTDGRPALGRMIGKLRRLEGPAALAIATYGSLTILMAAVTMVTPLRAWVQKFAWKPHFPATETQLGFLTPAGPGQALRPLAHPGTLILLVSFLSIALTCSLRRATLVAARQAAEATWRSAGAASLGVISMVGLSMLMEHCGMSYLLAQGLSGVLGAAYPILAPGVGMLGAFATGSNNNSNVLFGTLQKNAAVLLHLNPRVLVAAQTAGGALGSMLAPAKIIVGCSTVGQVGQEGQVLRRTVPYGLLVGLALGLLTWALAR